MTFCKVRYILYDDSTPVVVVDNKFIPALISILLVISSFSCVVKIPLHGDISGVVTDAETTEPIPQAKLNLIPTGDSILTADDGSYLLKNIESGSYHIQASKTAYELSSKSVTVEQAQTQEIDFALNGIPFIEVSDPFLDFGLDKEEMYFTISNAGKGEGVYEFSTGLDWITIDPEGGVVKDEVDTILVTIDRTGIPDMKIEEEILVIAHIGDGTQQVEIGVLVNGVADQDGNYYNVVTIGTQTWMAENLNTGKRIYWSVENRSLNDGVIEKYCYDDLEQNCDNYGGLYSWDEMMDYPSGDTGLIGPLQGICPDGWHPPQNNEWLTLFDYLGGYTAAGAAMKDTGTIEEGTGYWHHPNEGATNETGFSARPGGMVYWLLDGDEYIVDGLKGIGEVASFWAGGSNIEDDGHRVYIMRNTAAGITPSSDFRSLNCVNSVRCIKDE